MIERQRQIGGLSSAIPRWPQSAWAMFLLAIQDAEQHVRYVEARLARFRFYYPYKDPSAVSRVLQVDHHISTIRTNAALRTRVLRTSSSVDLAQHFGDVAGGEQVSANRALVEIPKTRR